MDKERIMTFGLENFKATKELLDYYDENVIVIKGKNMPESFKGSIRIDCFLIIYCFQGEISININPGRWAFSPSGRNRFREVK